MVKLILSVDDITVVRWCFCVFFLSLMYFRLFLLTRLSYLNCFLQTKKSKAPLSIPRKTNQIKLLGSTKYKCFLEIVCAIVGLSVIFFVWIAYMGVEETTGRLRCSRMTTTRTATTKGCFFNFNEQSQILVEENR